MAFQSARWRWEFLGTPSSNQSDANPPEGDTNPPGPGAKTHEVCCLSSILRNNFTPLHSVRLAEVLITIACQHEWKEETHFPSQSLVNICRQTKLFSKINLLRINLKIEQIRSSYHLVSHSTSACSNQNVILSVEVMQLQFESGGT